MSNLKHEEKEFDGIKFATTQYGAMRSLELLGKLAKTLGPAMGVLADSVDLEGDDFNRALPYIGVALRDLQPAEMTSLIKEILKGTTATMTENGTTKRMDLLDEKDINRVFDGRLSTMFKVVLFALKVNFADFGFGSAAKKESAPEQE